MLCLRFSLISILFVTKIFCHDLSHELLESISINNESNVELALKNGANVNVRQVAYPQQTALMLAVGNENKDIIELLLKHGANVNAADRSGWTPLMTVAVRGNIEIAELLLHYHANINAKDNYGGTALEKAIRKSHKDLVELFLQHGIFDNANLLIDAVGPSVEEPQYIAELLLKHGANVNATNKDGWSALFNAAFYGHKDAVELLLKYGANVNAVDNNGRTPLMATVESMHNHHTNIFELLLEHGADVNIQSNFGQTVLYDVIKGIHRKDRMEIIELLFNLGVDVNSIVSDREQQTPLLLAVKLQDKEMVIFLLNRGADREAEDHGGRTALDLAKYDPEIALLLRQ